MTQDELKTRTKKFAIRVINLVNALPKTTVGRAIGNQLIRSGTSVGANYRAVCRARSTKEFISKLGIVIEESDELTAIFVSSVKTAKSKSKISNPKS